MRAKILRIFHGPSLLSPNPVVVWTIDIATERASALAEAGWAEFRARYPAAAPNGPPAEADPALSIALLAAAWAKELQNSANGLIEDAGAQRHTPDSADGWIGFHDARLAVDALGVVLLLISQAGGEEVAPGALASAMARFRQNAAVLHPGPMSRVVAIGARARGVPVMPSHAERRIWHYGWGRAGRIFLEAASDLDGAIGTRISTSKQLTRQFLAGLGFPTAEHFGARTADEAVAIAARIPGPVVIKPMDRGQGKGVTVHIESETEIRAAFDVARAWTRQPILVEQFIPGDDYRLLVVGGTLAAAARREAASVTGDGRRSVRQLVEALNRRRAADPISARYLHQVELDQTLANHLRIQNATSDTVPGPGVTLTLRGNANVSTGGTPTNVLELVHPEVREMAEAIARNASLNAVGIDYITTDIARSWRETTGAVIEINVTPGLDVHVASGVEEAEIGAIVLGDVGRIPVAVVVASVLDQARLLDALRGAFALWPRSWRCGVLGPGELTVGRMAFVPPGSPHVAVRQLLQNRDCAAALLCVTPEDVAATGFPVDRCDLTVLRGRQAHALADRCSANVIDVPDNGDWPDAGTVTALVSALGPTGSE